MTKVIIAGSRSFNDYEVVSSFADYCLIGATDIEIVSGGANGVDKLGERYAIWNGFPIRHFVPDWDNLNVIPCRIKVNSRGKRYNALAGFARNEEMAIYSDVLIAFWDGKTKGTKDMIDRANKHDLKVFTCWH